MSVDLILWICAAISMGIAAFTVNTGRVNCFNLAWVFVFATFIFS